MHLRAFLICVISVFICVIRGYSEEESITITTYYPSPYGSYNELRTNRMAVGYLERSDACWDPDPIGGCLGTGANITDTFDFSGNSTRDIDLIVKGSVGIGTTSPSQRLEVAGGNIALPRTDYDTGELRLTAPGSGTIWNLHNRGPDDIPGGDDDKLYLTYYNGTAWQGPYLTVNGTTGNVGIGTTDPTAKLHIGGTAGVDGIKFPDNTTQVTAAAPGLSSIKVFTSDGTWTKPAGVTKVRVRVVGGGGGGGTGSGSVSAGAGGGGGGYAEKIIDVSGVTSASVTVGSAGVNAGNTGAGASFVGGNGGAGGDSSFGTYCSASGGGGGTEGPSSSHAAYDGAAGGAGSNGDINVDGGHGGPTTTYNIVGSGGSGGGSVFGSGGPGGPIDGLGGNGGSGYGAGGGGGGSDPTSPTGWPTNVSGPGVAGVVIVEEYK